MDLKTAEALATDLRSELHAVMMETLADQRQHWNWDYVPVRPEGMPTTHRAYIAGIRCRADCSKGCQYLSWWVPYCPDPMGNGFTPYGNSQTICFHLHHLYSVYDLQVGDIITFGSWGDDHAAMVLEKGGDPLLWSHGHQGAPNTYRLSWDRRPHQFLHMALAPIPVTPQEKLRSMTGWFSWVAWKLGEGAWKHYGKANASVRPNVPARIPLEWWARYAQYIKNRNGGDAATTHHIKEGT